MADRQRKPTVPLARPPEVLPEHSRRREQHFRATLDTLAKVADAEQQVLSLVERQPGQSKPALAIMHTIVDNNRTLLMLLRRAADFGGEIQMAFSEIANNNLRILDILSESLSTAGSKNEALLQAIGRQIGTASLEQARLVSSIQRYARNLNSYRNWAKCFMKKEASEEAVS